LFYAVKRIEYVTSLSSVVGGFKVVSEL